MRKSLSTLLKQVLALSAIGVFVASPIGCGDAKTGDSATERSGNPGEHADSGSGMRDGSGTQGGSNTKTEAAKTDEKMDEQSESSSE